MTGRYFQHYNGECMNIGLVNVADRPFKEFLHEAMKTNYWIYDLKLGAVDLSCGAPPAVPETALRSASRFHAPCPDTRWTA